MDGLADQTVLTKPDTHSRFPEGQEERASGRRGLLIEVGIPLAQDMRATQIVRTVHSRKEARMYDPPRPEGSERRRAAALRAHARASKVGAPYGEPAGTIASPAPLRYSCGCSDCGRRWLREASLHSPGRLRRDTTEPWAVRADRRISAGAGRPRERPKNHVVCQGADRTNMPCFFLRYVISALGTHTVPLMIPRAVLSPRPFIRSTRASLRAALARASYEGLASRKSLRQIGEPYPRLDSLPTYRPRMRG
jgi:hypothetical protein